MNAFKKTLAGICICLFVLMLLGQSTNRGGHGREDAYIRLAVMILTLVGLFYSTRWFLILSGRTHKVGRQAFAILWCCESILGILLGFGIIQWGGVAFGIGAIAVWSLSFWLTYRWLSKMRKEELTSLPAPS
jgi:hypothetical protein